jgi:hypothetical protein
MSTGNLDRVKNLAIIIKETTIKAVHTEYSGPMAQERSICNY